jgi:hypothetical protein
VGVYVFIKTPTFFYGSLIFVVLFVLIFIVVARDEIHLKSANGGTAESKIWTLFGTKKYKYNGLEKAKKVLIIDLGVSDAGRSTKYFLEFEDGYKLALPDDDKTTQKVISWFKEVYGKTLNIEKQKP